jgi:hypothetical protein
MSMSGAEAEASFPRVRAFQFDFDLICRASLALFLLSVTPSQENGWLRGPKFIKRNNY